MPYNNATAARAMTANEVTATDAAANGTVAVGVGDKVVAGDEVVLETGVGVGVGLTQLAARKVLTPGLPL